MNGSNLDAAGGAVLEMRNITKRFPGVVSNDRVDFDLRSGEIHCLLGENGAGKTTLMNILYGLYQMDEGEIIVDGERVQIRSPRDAIDLGIGMVHQFFTLIPRLSVLENIILGHEPTRGPFLDRKGAEREITRLQRTLNLEVDLKADPDQLSAGEKQKVEILKALYRGARILILDEPTSVLTEQEKGELMRTLRGMVEGGDLSVIFITHKLPEALAVSDRITILRKGKVVDILDSKDADMRQLAQKMVGRDVLFDVQRRPTVKGEEVLEVVGLHALGDDRVPALRGVSLSVREGEILGIAGVSGNGQRELMDAIAGVRRATAGRVFIKGVETTNLPPGEVRALSVGYIPENRLEKGILPDLSIIENMLLGVHSKPPYAHGWFLPFDRRWFIDSKEAKDHASRLVDTYDVDTPGLDRPAGKLSGGNIQKLILARELSRDPDLLLADKPTSGLDVGSQEFIRRRLMEERDRGKAILLVSEDLDEIMMVSDRIAVMYEGRLLSAVSAEEVTKEEIGAQMTGGREG